jgi:hypothetical protein
MASLMDTYTGEWFTNDGTTVHLAKSTPASVTAACSSRIAPRHRTRLGPVPSVQHGVATGYLLCRRCETWARKNETPADAPAPAAPETAPAAEKEQYAVGRAGSLYVVLDVETNHVVHAAHGLTGSGPHHSAEAAQRDVDRFNRAWRREQRREQRASTPETDRTPAIPHGLVVTDATPQTTETADADTPETAPADATTTALTQIADAMAHNARLSDVVRDLRAGRWSDNQYTETGAVLDVMREVRQLRDAADAILDRLIVIARDEMHTRPVPWRAIGAAITRDNAGNTASAAQNRYHRATQESAQCPTCSETFYAPAGRDPLKHHVDYCDGDRS